MVEANQSYKGHSKKMDVDDDQIDDQYKKEAKEISMSDQAYKTSDLVDITQNDQQYIIDTSEEVPIVNTFDQLGLPDELLRGKSSIILKATLFNILFVQGYMHMGSTNHQQYRRGQYCQ